jgi:hypothetical protein
MADYRFERYIIFSGNGIHGARDLIFTLEICNKGPRRSLDLLAAAAGPAMQVPRSLSAPPSCTNRQNVL